MLALVLTSALVLAPDRPEVPPDPPAVVRVVSGRATLVQGDEVRTLTRRERSTLVSGTAFVELVTGGEVEVSWSGLSSARLRGPAAFEFELEPRAEERPRPILRVLRFAWLEVEVRRGSQQILLPQAWTLSVARAALRVTASPSGAQEVRHHGGEPVSVRSRIARRVRWPERVESGRRIRLPAAGQSVSSGSSPWM